MKNFNFRLFPAFRLRTARPPCSARRCLTILRHYLFRICSVHGGGSRNAHVISQRQISWSRSTMFRVDPDLTVSTGSCVSCWKTRRQAYGAESHETLIGRTKQVMSALWMSCWDGNSICSRLLSLGIDLRRGKVDSSTRREATMPGRNLANRQVVSPTQNKPFGYFPAQDMPAAARQAIEMGKRIFLATGIKDLQTFLGQAAAKDRHWFLRIMPDADSLERALKLGVPRSNICAMQGPFSTEVNVALWSSWKVDCVVTKESGEAGGFQSKLDAARTLGIPLIVVARPKISYPAVAADFETLADLLERSLKNRESCMDLPTSANPSSSAIAAPVLNPE